jgi:hypothetical protein
LASRSHGTRRARALADLAGSEWPTLARRSLLELVNDGSAEDWSIGVELLADIREVFDAREVDRISSGELLKALVDMDERPWAEWRRGNPLTSRGLAGLLKPDRIQTRTVRFEDGTEDGTTAKGFLREQLEDAWKRYVPPKPTSHPSQRPNGTVKPKSGDSYPTQESLVWRPSRSATRTSTASAGSSTRVSGSTWTTRSQR